MVQAVNSFGESNKRRKPGLLYKSCHYNMHGRTDGGGWMDSTAVSLLTLLMVPRGKAKDEDEPATKSQLFSDLNDPIGSMGINVLHCLASSSVFNYIIV